MTTASNGNARPGRPGTAGLSSPFTHHPAVDGAAAAEPLDATHVEDVVRVEKPWGHEEIFGVLEGRYVGKLLHIRAGAALSLQKHLVKDETLAVRSGRVVVEHGSDPGRLESLTLEPGQQVLVRAGVVHRITADVDSDVLEVSTAWPGWRTDIVRLGDAYGREGTTAQ
jgi:mannose-6-phosphate isomerase-like protein (cupin superfamily)